jgi:glyoxylase-like metal-dependent hydrolase (beta-lactamase superfamily II)
MHEADFPTPEAQVGTIDPLTLESLIESGEDVTILDTRVESEYDTWRIGGETVESHNIPYFHFLDDPDDELLDRVPEADPLVVVCAKGGASEYVAGVLKAERDIEAVNLEDGMNGWANIYHREEVTAYDGPGTLYQYQRPSSGCLGYLVVSGGEAAVVDPLRSFTDRYLADAAELEVSLEHAIDTHVHADHVSGVRALDERGVDGVIPAASVQRGVTYADDLERIEDGEKLQVGEATIEAVHTPGHTTGMTSYLVGDSALLTGDGLFVESVARPDLEDGDEGAPDAARQLYETLQERILALPDDTVIAGGHASDAAESAEDGTFTARLGDLVAEMEPLRMDESAFVDVILADMPPWPANYEDIIATNLGQQSVDDDEAFELELGPNNCAASGDALTGD